MSPKRGDRAAPPPGVDEYALRFENSGAADGWELLCKQAPGNTRAAWVAITTDPSPRLSTPRRHRLKRELAAVTFRGRRLDQWQYEVTGAGRIWYLVDEEGRTCWITFASPGHPGATD